MFATERLSAATTHEDPLQSLATVRLAGAVLLRRRCETVNAVPRGKA